MNISIIFNKINLIHVIKEAPLTTKTDLIFKIFISLVSASVGLLVTNVSPIIIFVLAMTCWVIVSSLYSYRMYNFLFICLVFIIFMFLDWYLPLLTSPFKIYLVDSIVLLMIIVLLRIILNNSFVQYIQSPVTLIIFINFIIGFFHVLNGVGAGHNFNDIIGDYRRFFFYPLVTLVSLSGISKVADIQKLLKLFGIVLLITSSVAIYRVITGQTWKPEEYEIIGDFRAIGNFSGAIVVMGIGVSYGFSLINCGFRKYAFLLASGFLMGVAIIANFRLIWILATLMPVFVSYSTFRGQVLISRLMPSVLLTILAIIVACLILYLFFADWFELISVKFLQRLNFSKGAIGIDRWNAWGVAWEKFLSSPIIGVGIGQKFTYETLTSTGFYFITTKPVHNVFLSLLYQTGIIGGSMFVAIHLRVFWYMWQSLTRLNLHVRAPLAGILGGYLAILLLAMVEPMLESPTGTVAFYLLVGIMLKIVEIYARKNDPLVQGQP